MPRTDTEKLNQLHAQALLDFDKIHASQYDDRHKCYEDRRFYSIAGAQWEGDLEEQFKNRPRFEVNKTNLSVIRIINEYRNNRITVDFVSKDGVTDDELSDTCDGLYRSTEIDSSAEEAYDNAFEEAVGGGIGAWRLRAEYEDEFDPENEKQKILIEPIYDADLSVYFDLNAKRQDKRDAMCCYVLTSMSPAAFEERFGYEPVSSWNRYHLDLSYDWSTDDVVYIAEYYKVEEAFETLFTYQMMDGTEEVISEIDFENDEDLEERLFAIGAEEIKQRKIKRKRVRKYLLAGDRVLEDFGYVAGTEIPIVINYGKRNYVNNKERASGHVRFVKDAQRLKNVQLSKLGEIASLSPVEKPILTPEQAAGHEDRWAEDNIKNYPYMLVNAHEDMNGNPVALGPASYTKPPQIPPALGALLQITEQDMRDLLGSQQAGEELQPNVSGKAIELIQSRLDMQTAIYMSNMKKAIKRSGEIWLSMARELFVEPGRRMKTFAVDGEMGSVVINQASSGEENLKNDVSKANYDVMVSVGPSSESRRQATVRSLMGMMNATRDPETMQVLGFMAMMNMEGEGISDARKYFRKQLVRRGVIEPTDSERDELMAELRNQPPDAQQQYLQAAAASEAAKAQKAQADTALTLVKAEETQAKTLETLSEIDREERANAIVNQQFLQGNRQTQIGELTGDRQAQTGELRR
jgi:uncharacterized protein YjgD (DUF1641 family)